jgi:hypothetical protein
VKLEQAGKDASLRRRYLVDDVFGGDEEAYEAMQSASDGFEHGYTAIDDVRGHLEPVLERSMSYVRAALIRESGVAAEMRDRLLASGYEEPRGLVPQFSFVSGRLLREDTTQPPPEMNGAAIELEWNVEPPVAEQTESGDIQLSFPQNVTPMNLPPNTRLELSGAGMRAAYMKLSETKPFDVKVKRAGETEWEQVEPPEVDEEGPSPTGS